MACLCFLFFSLNIVFFKVHPCNRIKQAFFPFDCCILSHNMSGLHFAYLFISWILVLFPFLSIMNAQLQIFLSEVYCKLKFPGLLNGHVEGIWLSSMVNSFLMKHQGLIKGSVSFYIPTSSGLCLFPHCSQCLVFHALTFISEKKSCLSCERYWHDKNQVWLSDYNGGKNPEYCGKFKEPRQLSSEQSIKLAPGSDSWVLHSYTSRHPLEGND